MAGFFRWLIPVVIVGAAIPVGAQSKCGKLQLLAVGQAARRYAECAASAADTGTSVDQTCLDTAADKLRRKWERAAERSDCATAASATDAQAVVDSFLAAAVELTQPAHCCDTGANCFAHPSIDASTCPFELLGTLGPPGSVCGGATGDCTPPPGAAGPCCQLSYVCVGGPTGEASICTAAGGTFFASAICDPSGACVTL